MNMEELLIRDFVKQYSNVWNGMLAAKNDAEFEEAKRFLFGWFDGIRSVDPTLERQSSRKPGNDISLSPRSASCRTWCPPGAAEFTAKVACNRKQSPGTIQKTCVRENSESALSTNLCKTLCAVRDSGTKSKNDPRRSRCPKYKLHPPHWR